MESAEIHLTSRLIDDVITELHRGGPQYLVYVTKKLQEIKKTAGSPT